MRIGFGAPAYFWMLALLPLVWLGGRSRARPTGWSAHALIRALLLFCLVAALSQPVLTLRASDTMLVYLVDVSHSVSATALSAVANRIDTLTATASPGESRILAFGRQAVPVADTGVLRTLAARQADSIEGTLPDGTNLEQALAAARGEVRSSASGRIVLFSDGRPTEGDSLRMAERLAADRVPVFAEPTPSRDIGDTWIQDVRLPYQAVAEAVTTVNVIVGAQAAVTADVRLLEGVRILASVRTAVARGGSTVSLDVIFRDAGPHLVEATVITASDVLSNNNTFRREVVVAPQLRVLYVHAPGEEGRQAPGALVQAGVKVTMAEPQELPRATRAFDRWDVVVVSNVGRTLIAPDAMTALGSWVEDRGGGLLMAGGNAVFGEGVDGAPTGYRRSELERVLPVTFDRDDEPDVALVIVLDRSWSMNGAPMDLSKSAAEAAARTLSGTEVVGVLSFNDSSNWDVPVGRVRDSRATLHDAIGHISASGPTAIYPALESAYEALAAVRARSRHVVLLSDGQTPARDFEGLVRKMAAARITVSSVAFGPEADVALLGNIAKWGGGRNYVVQDAQQIPEIFVTEAKTAAKPGAGAAEPKRPIVRQSTFFVKEMGALPPLEEHNRVTRKAGAIEIVSTSGNDPLLTIWPAGLGRTGMFAADVDGLWTREWVGWPRFGAFFTAVVRSLAPDRQPASALNIRLREEQGRAFTFDVSIDMRDPDGQPLDRAAPVVDIRSGGQRAELPLVQVAPGRYAAPLVADATEPLEMSVRETSLTVGAARIFVADPAAEYRFAAPDESLLAAIAHATGGRVRPTPDDLRHAPQTSALARHGLSTWLLALACLLWPLDIAARRLQW